MNIQLNQSWLEVIGDEFEKPYFQELKQFLVDEITAGKTIYPHPKNIFQALNTTPFDQVKVVILGQDPYINPEQAMGLCFSVPQSQAKLPPSLKNIYKELVTDIDGFQIPQHGDLTKWAEQGVLLLNAVLTVEAGLSASHAKHGWEDFTDRIIAELSEKREGIVFLLWGNYAKKKGLHIDRDKHLVLESGHPSPLSVRYFLGCKHFSKTNEYLVKQEKEIIDWQV